MSEVPSRTVSSTIETIEWRLARPQDGPVWVALTRQGRAPLLPRGVLTEPTRRLVLDRRDREEELRYFLSELPNHLDQCFLLWHAGSVIGRACFCIEDNEAKMWGLALLPNLPSDMVKKVIHSLIARASHAGATHITAVFEASHLSAFEREGFHVVRRYTTIVAPTEDTGDEPEPPEQRRYKASNPAPPYYIRPMKEEDRHILEAMRRAASFPNGNHLTAQRLWYTEFDQLMRGQKYQYLENGAYVAEGHLEGESTASLLGVIQMSQWRGLAVITDVFVARPLRRRRIGTALVDHARDQLAQRDYTTVVATINEQSRISSFFRFAGFRNVQQCTLVGYLKLPLQRHPRIAGT